MKRWIFEPGHTTAEFTARHMMVSNVRGYIKDVHGELEFDPEDPTRGSVDARLDVRYLGSWPTPYWEDGVTGDPSSGPATWRRR